jgi:hypothetical protein
LPVIACLDGLLLKSERQRDLICLGALLLVCIAVWIPRLAGPINFRWDASTYYVLGTALAEGKGYRLLNEPGEIQAVQYPPLLPMVVAGHQWAMGTTDYIKVGRALRLTYAVLSVVFLAMAYGLARTLLPRSWSLLVGLITALSLSSFLLPSDVLYAELPFAVVSTGFLLCQSRKHPLFAGGAGILGAAAYLLRTAGLALLSAWILESLIQRRFRQAVVRVGVSALPILLWQAHVWRVTRSYEYHHPAYSYQHAAYYYSNVTYGENGRLVDPFRPELGQLGIADLGKRMVSNVGGIPVGLGESAVVPTWLAPSLLKQLHRATGVPSSAMWRVTLSSVLYISLFGIGLLALGGALMVVKREQWFLSLYFGMTLALVVVTPWQNQFWRYLSPVAPLTLMFVFLILMRARQRLIELKAEWPRAAAAFVAIGPVAGMLIVQTVVVVHLFRSMEPVSYYDSDGREHVFKLLDYGSEWHALDPTFEWIRRNTVAAAVIATSVPQLAYLRTGHKAVLPPFELNPNIANLLLEEVPVTYLVLDRFGLPGISERYLAPVIAQEGSNWRLVFTAPDSRTRVYERTR